MAKPELKYWVFHQEHLTLAIEEYIRARVAAGESAAKVRAEVEVVEKFLASNAGAVLLGGRAG